MDASRLASAPRQAWLRLAAIAVLYVALGCVLGFIQGGIGPILRTRGVALASMGWVFALYLPFGMTFLWAPCVDHWRLPWLGRRSGWIVAAQGIAVLLVAALALGDRWPMPVLFGLGLATALAMATMDLALDAWTVERVPAPQRPAAAGAKVGGLSLGAILGGGVLVALFPRFGWLPTFALMAGLVALATCPVAWMARSEGPEPAGTPPRAGLTSALRQPAMRRRLLRIVLLTCALMALFNLNRLMLVDCGVPLDRIGWVLGLGAPLANLAASAVVPWLLRRCRRGIVLGALAAGAAASALLIVIALVLPASVLAIGASLLAGAMVAGLYIVIASVILGWAAGPQAATDYALLYGLGRLVGTFVLLGLPGLVAVVGWQVFYGGCAVAVLAAVGYFAAGLGEPPRSQARAAAVAEDEGGAA